MPSQAKKPRLCIIGDSHIGSVRQAENRGLLEFSGYDVEYWGAEGPAYRKMFLQDGRIVVRSKAAREKFAEVNRTGRQTIAPQDFDEYLFFGARVDCIEFFGAHLQWQLGENGWLSSAALAVSARTFLASSRSYRIAAIFAQQFGASVSFIPASFPAAGIVDQTQPGYLLDQYPSSIKASRAERDVLWDALISAAGADTVTFIRQPEDSIVDGLFTDPAYAIENAVETGDAGHKSPEYAAMILSHWTGRTRAAA